MAYNPLPSQQGPARGSPDYLKHSEALGLQIGTDDSGIAFFNNNPREETASALTQYQGANAHN